MKNSFKLSIAVVLMLTVCASANKNIVFPNIVTVQGVAQNPEGIEYNKNDNTFLLSSLNAMPIVKVNFDGTFKPFTSGEKFPMSTAGLQIDYKRNRLLVTAFNGLEVMDKDPKTKGASHLRIYNLKTGVMQEDIDLSSLVPTADAYFANDIAVDNEGNVYISDWYANLIYKVDTKGKASIFWKNSSAIAGRPNGLDFHPNGYLLVSVIKVNNKGIYTNYALIKIPLNKPSSSTVVDMSNAGFSGFDGMVVSSKGNVIGITNNQKTGGGNILIELSGKDDWKSAKVINSKSITPSTTVAITPENHNYIINQDFSDNFKKTWRIEQIKF